MIYTVNVRQEDIDKCTPRSSSKCPVASAIRRSTGIDDVTVSPNTCILTVVANGKEYNYYGIMPGIVPPFVKSFDSGLPVQPFEFQLNVSEEFYSHVKKSQGILYTVDTIYNLMHRFPGKRLILVMRDTPATSREPIYCMGDTVYSCRSVNQYAMIPNFVGLTPCAWIEDKWVIGTGKNLIYQWNRRVTLLDVVDVDA